MKNLLFTFCLFTSFILTSCLSTNTSNNSFSTNEKQKSENMVISTDEFTGTKTITHKDIYMDFTASSDSLYFEPFFIHDANAVKFFLKIQFEYFGNDLIFPKKIILLGDTGKVSVNITASQEVGENKLGSGSILGRRNIITANQGISKEDYEKISKFFEENKKVRLAIYTSNNKAQEMKEYSTRAHTIFSDSYNYYKNHLLQLNNLESINYLIFE